MRVVSTSSGESDGLCPAVDGGQRCAQLMRNAGDKIILRFIRLRDLIGHAVDGLGKLADLVVVVDGGLGFKIALGDLAGDADEVADRFQDERAHDAANDGRHKQDHDGDDGDGDDVGFQERVDHRHAGNIAQHAHDDLSVVDRHGNRHDGLAGVESAAPGFNVSGDGAVVIVGQLGGVFGVANVVDQELAIGVIHFHEGLFLAVHIFKNKVLFVFDIAGRRVAIEHRRGGFGIVGERLFNAGHIILVDGENEQAFHDDERDQADQHITQRQLCAKT